MKKLKMKPHNEAGRLITVCGLDGCGKTTVISLLLEELLKNGYEVYLTKQPTDSVRKSKIFRSFHDSSEHGEYSYRALSLLAASDRIMHSRFEILKALARGAIVISDRYFYSCLANLRARGYTGDRWIYEISREIPKPDIAFFLDTPVDIAVRRVRERPSERESYIDIDFEERLRREYVKICKASRGILVDSSGSESDTFAKIKKEVLKIL